MNTVAVITTRSKSTRFPNKFKADICGKPMLVRIVESARKSKIDRVVVATVLWDKPVIQLCQENDIDWFAGSEDDILGRIYWAAKASRATRVVRLWGDSPLIRAVDINFALDYFKRIKPTYLSVFTLGGVIAVMSFRELKRLENTVSNLQDREWLHKYQSTLGGAIRLDMGKPITIDTPEDLEGVRELVRQSSVSNR